MTGTLTKCWTGSAAAPQAFKLLRTQGYRDPERIRPRVRKSAEVAIAEAAALAMPSATFVERPLAEITRTGARLADGTQLKCAAHADHLSGSHALLIFVITLGPALDAAIAQGFEDGTDPLRPLFLDNAGWLMVEAATRDFSGEIKAQYAASGQSLTKRMAPGYSYPAATGEARVEWPLTDQATLFDQFSDVDVPVELLESGAMLPRMSRSGVFGIRQDR